MKVLEIGCAPGKHLAWLASKRAAVVSGIDITTKGIAFCNELFGRLGLAGKFYCEDVFESNLEERFDLVYSIGLIEHFLDPTLLIRRHLEFVRSGGDAIIAIPNYCSWYGSIQRKLDLPNLEIHNLGIMNKGVLRTLIPTDLASEQSITRSGYFSPGLLSLHKRVPRLANSLLSGVLNLVGIFQPIEIQTLAPWLVLRMRRL